MPFCFFFFFFFTDRSSLQTPLITEVSLLAGLLGVGPGASSRVAWPAFRECPAPAAPVPVVAGRPARPSPHPAALRINAQPPIPPTSPLLLLVLAPALRSAPLATRRHTGIFKALSFTRQLEPSRSPAVGSPGRAARFPPGLVHAPGARLPLPCQPAGSRRGAGLKRPGPRTARGRRGRGGAGRARGPCLRSAPPSCALSSGGASTLPPPRRARGRYSRSRLSMQSAVQPRGIPRPARVPLRPSILPAPLRRGAQTRDTARPPGALPPPLRPAVGWAILAFSPPLPLYSWQGRPLSLAATNVSLLA